MANATYEIMWRDAMGDLNEQLNVEGVEEDDVLVNQSSDGQKSVSSLENDNRTFILIVTDSW